MPPAREPSSWTLTVKDSDGSVLLLLEWVSSTETILNVKRRLRDGLGVPTNMQRLVFAGSQLEDGRTLSCYNIRGAVTVFMLLQPAPGGTPANEEPVDVSGLPMFLAQQVHTYQRMLLHTLHNRPGVLHVRVKTLTGRVHSVPVLLTDTLEVRLHDPFGCCCRCCLDRLDSSAFVSVSVGASPVAHTLYVPDLQASVEYVGRCTRG